MYRIKFQYKNETNTISESETRCATHGDIARWYRDAVKFYTELIVLSVVAEREVLPAEFESIRLSMQKLGISKINIQSFHWN